MVMTWWHDNEDVGYDWGPDESDLDVLDPDEVGLDDVLLEEWDPEPREDFGWFGEAGLWD